MKDKFLKIAGVNSEKEFYQKFPSESAFFEAHPEAQFMMKSGGNVPTNPALWSRAKSAAKAKYDVYPSAYANGFAAKWYKSKGGGWKKAEYGMEVMGEGGVPNNPGFNALPPSVQQNIISNMAQGGAVDLNAFYNQPRFIQTNIMEDGGMYPNMLPEFQWAGQFMGQNPFSSDPNAFKQPSEVRTPEQRTSFMNNLNSSFSAAPAAAVTNTNAASELVGSKATKTGVNPPNTIVKTNSAVAAHKGVPAVTTATTSGTPTTDPKSNMAASAAAGAAAGAKPATTPAIGTSQLRDPNGKNLSAQQTIYARPLANHQVLNNKAYSFASDASLMPFMGTGMLDNDGLSGYLKAGLGMMSGIGGMMTGLDNAWRGFKGRKEDVPGAAKTTTNYQKPEMMQESPIQEMQRKKQQQINPSMVPPGMNFSPSPAVDMNNTAAYGGELYKAQNGFNYSLNPNVDPSKISIGQNQLGLDPMGLQRTLGANAGLSMFNEVVGMGQAKKQNRMAQVQQGMSDFAYQPDDSNSMAMGYDTLNTGPGQTQAPNLYTPVQYAGQQMASQYEEGGEYDWTPEQIHQFLAEGGEIEFV